MIDGGVEVRFCPLRAYFLMALPHNFIGVLENVLCQFFIRHDLQHVPVYIIRIFVNALIEFIYGHESYFFKNLPKLFFLMHKTHLGGEKLQVGENIF